MIDDTVKAIHDPTPERWTWTKPEGDMTWTKCEDGIPTGYRQATYGEKATHAICHHNVLVRIEADSHVCRWTPLVEIEPNWMPVPEPPK